MRWCSAPFRFDLPSRILSAFVISLVLTPFAGRAEAQLANGIPNLCTTPTVTSTRSGSWSDPGVWSIGQIPSVNDRVTIAAGTTVTYDRQSDADIQCVNVIGQLTFRADISTRLTVGTLTVMPGGGLQIGTNGSPIAAGATAEIVIADRPVDTGLDPEQYGTGILGFGRITMHGAVKSPTFVRLSAEANAGQAALSLSAGVSGWQGGDRLVVPGTNQSSSDGTGYQGQWETPTLAAASGSSLALTSGLAFPHRGGRNAGGALVFLPHVGNISRNIVIRSQNPNGTRGHVLMTDRAEVDIRYVAFKDLGRTTISPVDSTTVDSSGHATHIGSNQVGRYSLHLHHLFGPAAPPPNSYQYVLIGNAIDGGTKWGITIHNTHYGLVQDNVIYNAAGAGIMTEDGSETANVIQNNFIVRSWGTGHERADGRQGSNDWGWEGSGIWLRGPDNIIRNNVIANSNAYAVTYMMLGVGNVLVPNAPGNDPRTSGHAVNMMTVPLREFSSNEFYAAHRGITVWNLGANCCTEVFEAPVSTFLNTRMWHVGVLGFYGYGENRVTFDGWVHYNDPASLNNTHENPKSFYFGDYIARNIVIRQADIQGLRIGIQAPIKAGDTRDIYGSAPGTLVIENSVLKNYWNIYTSTPYGVTGGGAMIPSRLVIARNVQFGNVPGASTTQAQAHIYRTPTSSCPIAWSSNRSTGPAATTSKSSRRRRRHRSSSHRPRSRVTSQE
jgi:G8 domain-containing protein/parallel beta helix pectate lyase-like protein